MTEDKRHELQKVATQLPFMPMNNSNQVVKASEKIEMQRATAQVLASFQMAIHRPRNEQECYERIMELCENVAFASDALYKKPVGGGAHAEGVGINATKTICRIWTNIDAGFIEHGSYDNESQMEAYCYDLEANYRFAERYTVKHERKANEQIKAVTDPQQIAVIVKARSSIEVRNCMQSVIPKYIWDEVETKCKRTLYSTVPNVQEAWSGHVTRWAQVGVKESSLFRYVNRNPSDKIKLTAADIVDLRMLWTAYVDDASVLDTAFPERDKKVNPSTEAAKPEGKPSAQKGTATTKPVAKPESKSSEVPGISEAKKQTEKSSAQPSSTNTVTEAPKPSAPAPVVDIAAFENSESDSASAGVTSSSSEEAIRAEAESHFDALPEDEEAF